ncbi:tripartite tricarboxylate transporter TctB family protein (plasmid) [Bosea sp. F3-2]|uniref:tripartite tricarboxylate transporter TctB family protein n=1 Tax=Bosea sp. F3-2 TaxID=2599640 RepID=UPI0011EF74FF|nr:tripartite tricarboxylate transporter TctB family protein [Bosea sp. F3-2]QEL27376.1 tripartite tricarboxylate transporter TctB family protein [Bosea sp. F3-2]
MMLRSPKDFGAGLLYVGLGLAALWFGRDYSVGSAGRMGPGYFPLVLGSLMVLIGIASLVRSFLVAGSPIGAVAWKALVLIVGATSLFGWLLPRAGTIVALMALILVSGTASRHFRLDWRNLAIALAMTLACVLVFIKGLGVPMPILGSFFG